MKRTKRSRRLGNLVFFVPVIVILALIVLGLLSVASSESGTLVVRALSSDRYTTSVPLHVTVTIGLTKETTPFNLTLAPGLYTVVYGKVAWYSTPPTRAILLQGRAATYAIGTYLPVLKSIAIDQSGFNTTSVTALHGVTPVVWVNRGTSANTLFIDGVGSRVIAPAQNLTVIFPYQGTFGFTIPGTDFSGSVQSL